MADTKQPQAQADDWEDVDDWQDVEVAPSAPSAASQPSQGQTFLESAGNSLTMGYLPHIQAATAPAITKGLDLLTGDNQYDSMPSYVERRDANIARQQKQAAAHPGTALTGTIAGALATAPIAAAGMAKAIPTLAKGVGFLRGAATGAAQGGITGAVYNPGDTAGQVNPLQLEERAVSAAGGAATGGVLGAGAGLLRRGAEKSRMIGRVKNSAELQPMVKAEIDSAMQSINTKQIKPRADKLAELLKGKSVELNPDRFKESVPNLAKSMAKKVGPEGRMSMSATRAQRLKRLLDSKSDYAQGKPFDVAAQAKGETAKSSADIVRRKLEGVHADVGPLNDEMREIYQRTAPVKRAAATRPISAIKGGSDLDKGSSIDYIDKMAGSKLERLSEDIQGAKELLIHPANFVKPLEAPNELRKVIVRGAHGAARGATSDVNPVSLQSIMQMLEEQQRKKDVK